MKETGMVAAPYAAEANVETAKVAVVTNPSTSVEVKVTVAGSLLDKVQNQTETDRKEIWGLFGKALAPKDSLDKLEEEAKSRLAFFEGVCRNYNQLLEDIQRERAIKEADKLMDAAKYLTAEQLQQIVQLANSAN